MTDVLSFLQLVVSLAKLDPDNKKKCSRPEPPSKLLISQSCSISKFTTCVTAEQSRAVAVLQFMPRNSSKITPKKNQNLFSSFCPLAQFTHKHRLLRLTLSSQPKRLQSYKG